MISNESIPKGVIVHEQHPESLIILEKEKQSVIDEIKAERERQISKEGWDFQHDDCHMDESLAAAAASYALPESLREYEDRTGYIDNARSVGETNLIPVKERVPTTWPLNWNLAWNPKNRRRDLIRAAALIVAEVERIDRKGKPL